MAIAHETYMQRCLQLAQLGLGTTQPNPSVGAVIVHENTIIGEGYTSPYGGPHAEVNAVASVSDKSLLASSTIYVTLEPCSHFGKTPPCADLIVKHKIPKVVIGTIDPFAKVAGRGIQRLRDAGIEVITDVLKEECRASNKRFFTYHEKKRPYIILKWAETADGFIDQIRTKDSAIAPNWISNLYSRQLVHKWRTEEQAILVGTTTALNDNPKLNVRDWTGKSPLRLVIDRSLKIPENYHLLDASQRTIVFTAAKKENLHENLIFETIDFSENVPQQICDVLYKHQIQSVIIEGGKFTLNAFISANLWDEARVFTGTTTFIEGVTRPIVEGKIISKEKIKDDTLTIYTND